MNQISKRNTFSISYLCNEVNSNKVHENPACRLSVFRKLKEFSTQPLILNNRWNPKTSTVKGISESAEAATNSLNSIKSSFFNIKAELQVQSQQVTAKIKSIKFSGFNTIIILALCFVSCSPKNIVNILLPKAPTYPDFADKTQVINEAKTTSNNLNNYIEAWFRGEVSAEIPTNLLPKGIDLIDAPYALVQYEDINTTNQWMVRNATYELNYKALRGLYADPHCTYIVPASVILPFEHKLVLEGQFPHSRFFDIQMSPPFNPSFYYQGKKFGSPEVPIVDVDIEPELGNSNPFRPNADRNAIKRNYKVTFIMKEGNGIEIEPAYREPLYRSKGNTRFASALQYQGPLGYQNIIGSNKRGKWDDGTLWIRY